MKLILSHPTGNSNVRALSNSLFEREMLAEFHTTLSVKKDDFWLSLLPGAIRNELLRKSFPIPRSKIFLHPWREVARLLLIRLGLEGTIEHERGWASTDQVYQHLDKAVANRIELLKQKNEISGVYAYEDGALATFIRAKELGLPCVYDMPIAYWQTVRTLLDTEAQRFPAWRNTFGGGIDDSLQKLERKTRELELADIIVGPGKFVIDSLPQWAAGKKTIVSPFGSPDFELFNNEQKSDDNKINRPLRILFAGSMGQRKGLADLFSAFTLLHTKHIELVVIGSLMESPEFYKKQFPSFIYEGTRPHHKVLELMRSCDVLCLPSIVEGRALVMQEAMSQGLPLIITPNTGGDDLIEEKETGFLIPIRNPEAIAEKITWFAENRSQLPGMSEKAKQKAAQYTWKKYGDTVADELAMSISKSSI